MPGTWFLWAGCVMSAGWPVVNALRAISGRAGAAQTFEQKTFSCSDYMMIYSMPKTGTTTLQKSTGPLCDWTRGSEFPYVGEVRDEGYPHAIDVHLGHVAAHDFIRRVPPNRTLWILSAVRFPVDRLVSDWFQNNYCLHDDSLWAAKLYDEFVWRRAYMGTQEYFSEWANSTGLDLLSQGFDHEKKHKFIEYDLDGRSIKVILLRLEDIGDWEAILSQYLPGWTLKSENQGDEKPYAEVYEAFKQSFFYSEDQLQKLLDNSPELDFYTEDEIAQYVADVRTVPKGVDNVAMMGDNEELLVRRRWCDPL